MPEPEPTRAKREVIRCRDCKLNQYLPASGNCRRCHSALKPEPPRMLPVIVHHPERIANPAKYDMGTATKLMREAMGLSQRDVATKMGTARTWVSRIENETVDPTLKSVLGLSDALGIPPYRFVRFAVLCAEAKQ